MMVAKIPLWAVRVELEYCALFSQSVRSDGLTFPERCAQSVAFGTAWKV